VESDELIVVLNTGVGQTTNHDTAGPQQGVGIC